MDRYIYLSSKNSPPIVINNFSLTFYVQNCIIFQKIYSLKILRTNLKKVSLDYKKEKRQMAIPGCEKIVW